MDAPRPSTSEFFDAFGTRIRRGDVVAYARKHNWDERLQRGTVQALRVTVGWWRGRPPHQYLVIRPDAGGTYGVAAPALTVVLSRAPRRRRVHGEAR